MGFLSFFSSCFALVDIAAYSLNVSLELTCEMTWIFTNLLCLSGNFRKKAHMDIH